MDPAEEESEVWQSRLLIRWLGHGGQVEPVRLEPPEPDVQVDLPDGRVGIEVTGIVPGGQENRDIEGARKAVLRGAEERYAATGRPPILVRVQWTIGYWPTKAHLAAASTRLADLAIANAPAPYQTVTLDRAADPAPELPPGLDLVWITGMPDGRSGWLSPAFAFVAPVARGDVALAFGRKNGKPRNYKGEYRQVWLLIAMGSDGPSTWGALSEQLAEAPFESAFDRAFLFSGMQLGFQEVPVARVGAT